MAKDEQRKLNPLAVNQETAKGRGYDQKDYMTKVHMWRAGDKNVLESGTQLLKDMSFQKHFIYFDGKNKDVADSF